jgi:hypothetical protein
MAKTGVELEKVFPFGSFEGNGDYILRGIQS